MSFNSESSHRSGLESQPIPSEFDNQKGNEDMNPGEVIKPCVTKEMAKEMARHIYGLEVIDITQMVSFDDLNFHIKVSQEHHNPHLRTISPHGYTLKITNTSKSANPGHFESMHSALKHLYDEGLRVPLPVPNMEGQTWKMEKVPLLKRLGVTLDQSSESNLCGVHLLTYLPGVPVGSVTLTTDILFQWGNLLAKFHDATRDFSNQVLREKLIFWNLEHIPEIENFMVGLEDDKSSLVMKVLKKYPKEVPALSTVPRGYIHGDFNENNILAQKKTSKKEDLQSSGEYKIDGILDLEDMHFGTYAWDVGMMLAYASLDCHTIDPLVGMGHALAGYMQQRSLNEKELRLLKICAASRLCQSLVLGAYSYRLDPKNSYLIISARTGWSRLKKIWETPNEKLLEKWAEIRKSYDMHS